MGSAIEPDGLRCSFRRVNQGCVRISFNRNRFSGSSLSIAWSSESAAGGIFDHNSSFKSALPPELRYWLNSQLCFVGSSHGVFPTSNTNNTIPQDQISATSGL